MGCVYRPTYRDRAGNKRKSKLWWVQYYVNGKSFFEGAKTADRAEALRYLKRREGEAAKGVPIVKGQQTVRFAELAQDLLNDQQANGLRSIRDTEMRLRLHILPAFGKAKAASIDPAAIRAYIAQRQSEGASNGSVNRELAAIRRAFTLALDSGRVAYKPHIHLLKEGSPRKGFFEWEQFTSVRAHLPEHMQGVAEFAYITGWRKNEVLSLQWPQVDFNARTVRLFDSKSGEGRVFPFTPELEAVLRAQLARADELKRTRGVISPWVFTRPVGKRPDKRDGQRIAEFKRSWKTACKKAGVPDRIFHDFRRTAVRNLERAGVPRSVAMKLTGHKTESVYRRYDIVSEGDLQLAAERLGAFTAATANAEHLKSPLKVAKIGHAG